MTTDYYKHSSGQPITLSRGGSAAIRAEFDAIQLAFDKLPSVADLNSKTGASSAQSGSSVTGIMGGTTDVITGQFTPAIFALISGMALRGRVNATNMTATPTFAADGTPPLVIVKLNNTPLVPGDIPQWPEFIYDGTLTKWVLKNPSNLDKVTAAALLLPGAAATIGSTPAGNLAATNVQAALNELDTEKASISALALGTGAASIGNSPAGSIAATTVQGALNELDLEKAALTGAAFSGAVSATTFSAATITETSDETLKQNWTPLPDNLLEAFASIGKMGLFDWVESGEPGIGVGAQSLEAVLDRFVVTAADGTKSVKYGVAALVMCYLLAQEVLALRGKK